MTYAAATDVSVEKSRLELERTLTRYGAESHAYAFEQCRAMVMFHMSGRRVRFVLPLPDRNDPVFTRHARGKRTESAALAAWEQACRQRWRALNLVVKAKLEAIEADISSFDLEFAAFIMLPNGTTVGDTLLPAIDTAYRTGEMPSMLALGR